MIPPRDSSLFKAFQAIGSGGGGWFSGSSPEALTISSRIFLNSASPVEGMMMVSRRPGFTSFGDAQKAPAGILFQREHEILPLDLHFAAFSMCLPLDRRRSAAAAGIWNCHNRPNHSRSFGKDVGHTVMDVRSIS